MTRREEIIARLAEIQPIVEEHNQLKYELAPLQEAWSKDNLSIEDQLKEYFENIDERGKMLPFIPSKDKYPILGKWAREGDVGRGRTINLFEYFEDDIFYLTEPEEKERAIKAGSFNQEDQEDLDNLIPLFVEIMENNIAGFTMDW